MRNLRLSVAEMQLWMLLLMFVGELRIEKSVGRLDVYLTRNMMVYKKIMNLFNIFVTYIGEELLNKICMEYDELIRKCQMGF